jgi:hypothetical protein
MESEIWWERRRENERTNVYLSRVLRELGATRLAEQAWKFHYDDYFCPNDIADGMEIVRLVRDLRQWMLRDPLLGPTSIDRGRVMLEAVMNGEFDGTRAEAELWMKSSDGQQTWRSLVDGR